MQIVCIPIETNEFSTENIMDNRKYDCTLPTLTKYEQQRCLVTNNYP